MNLTTRRILVVTAVIFGGVLAFVNLPNLLFPARVQCPLLVWLRPLPRSPIAASDYLDLKLFPGLSSWRPFEIKIYADAKVERRSKICPLDPADSKAEIDPAKAKELIGFARDQGFCRLCALYRPPAGVAVVDAGSTRITLSTAGRIHSAADAAGSPPDFYNELVNRAIRLSGITPLIDWAKYTPERKAFCDAYQQKHSRTMMSPDDFF